MLTRRLSTFWLCLFGCLATASLLWADEPRAPSSGKQPAAASAAKASAAGATSQRAPQRKPQARIDWTPWQEIPVLHEGRIKPLDTYANEVASLVTGRSTWTEVDPETKAKTKYTAVELLYSWITDRESWTDRAFILCEYRPLREHLELKEIEGKYVAISELFDPDKLGSNADDAFKSKNGKQLFDRILNETRLGKKPDAIGETPAERKLHAKGAELLKHLQVFREAADGRTLFVVPGLDPQTLVKQTDPDKRLRPWISLHALLHAEHWDATDDVTVGAVAAPSHQEFMDWMQDTGYTREYAPHLFISRSDEIRKSLLPLMQAVKPTLAQTVSHYQQVDEKGSEAFTRSLQKFADNLRQLGERLNTAREKMTADSLPEGFPEELKQRIKPLDPEQIAASAYPWAGSTSLEVHYNHVQPFFQTALAFSFATVLIILSTLVPFQRQMYAIGLVTSAVAVGVATWAFWMRILVAGRPPVTNMYETVVWVSYVVAVLGLFFGILPQTWPGLEWAWRLTAMPGTWESTPQAPSTPKKLASDYLTAVEAVASAIRLAGFIGLMWVLTSSDSTFRVTSLLPPTNALKHFAFGSLMTWLVGFLTSVTAAFYTPRFVLTMLLAPVTIVSELRRNRKPFWESLLESRFFLLGSMTVGSAGMLLADYAGTHSPDVLNPAIGSIAAVLRNNYWLTIHVLTIVSSYGAGALAWGLGNIAMFYYLFGSYQETRLLTPLGKHRPASRGNSDHLEEPGDSHATDSSSAEVSESLGSRLKRVGGALSPGQLGQTLAAGFRDLGTGDDHLALSRVRPPDEVNTLAAFGYKGMQVAVLLLAAGTILGGLWADVSWGRFWDWDPKEVWALISLLCYLVFLHGRFAGWTGTFGTNAGSVLCFQAIIMSWYGVNFVLPTIYGFLHGTNTPTSVGLHSYATGAGGLGYVISLVVFDLVLVLAAWARYSSEVSRPRAAATPPVEKTTV